MFETILDEEERGQVGIGTLIVFIAMVLVAAIAAGVLINTAGFLQTQAEATGQESTQQVSDRLQVVSQSGTFDDNQGDGQIVELDFVLAQSPGASNVDLSETSVELIGESGQETFTLSKAGSDGTDIDIFKGENSVVFTDSSDRAQVTIGLDAGSGLVSNNAGDSPYVLEEGDSLTVTFTTPSGATTTSEIRVPSTVVSDSVRL
ncbi:flagellin [Halorubrum ezzemoulense]|uniref:archaellin/type IV pilin N-terminal domain-containing protein n=1 Tax=Halorubrum ezzemoulense TaxID=337243 RepID=UPI00232F25B7|nr:archaellin/type IV pilin N-terminal domain-containing protein [Halorubrum ezzemoulense]MDB2252465.1 flagellin [Halorubrum ezzemoulense]MDB9280960.1 flagellin [Halorubrum ezzemoulense]MDB9284477.1 flagellin [Halorubrum ezzemoulense]